MLAACALLPAAGAGQTPSTEVPVFSREVPRGTWSTTPAPAAARLPARVVDGHIGDWVGESTRMAGTTVASRGELVYQDHLFDAYGPDDGRDKRRLAVLDPANAAVPETYRLDAAMQADLPGELGFDTPAELKTESHYGDMPRQDAADLEELRLAADRTRLWVMARTTTLTKADQTALLVLLDTAPGSASHPVPWNSELRTDRAETALLLAGDRGWMASLKTGEVTELPPGSVATDPNGYTNAIEAAIPRSLAGAGPLRVAAATAPFDPAKGQLADVGPGPNVANVAFRHEEPVRNWFDKQQALALGDGSMDAFFQPVDPAALARGLNQRFEPGSGYFERVFVSSERISAERSEDGVFQHYGIYLPRAYRPGGRSPLQLWLHWRGGDAHSAAALIPRMFKELGEDQDTVVVSPRGRGSSTWYVGKGQVDLDEVWADVHRSFSVDERRTYLAGHSMGGYGSYLMSVLHPDWFAAAMPVSPPVTQGAWTGVDFDGCDDYHFEGSEYTPCYIAANDSDPRAQHTRRMLDNVRHVPLAIYAGVEDELVPFTGEVRQMERLVQLGYRHRLYAFPAAEHYTPPVMDEWSEGAKYMHSFATDPSPARVTYLRDMPFEHAVETVQSGGVSLDFDFDHAYWMSELTPADDRAGVARFDGRSLAVSDRPVLTLPEAGGPAAPGQLAPWTMVGLRWEPDPTKAAPPTANGFDVTLAGARRVRLDLSRMKIDPRSRVTGAVKSDHALTLRLAGGWRRAPAVKVNGAPAAATLEGGVLSVELPAGASRLALG